MISYLLLNSKHSIRIFFSNFHSKISSMHYEQNYTHTGSHSHTHTQCILSLSLSRNDDVLGGKKAVFISPLQQSYCLLPFFHCGNLLISAIFFFVIFRPLAKVVAVCCIHTHTHTYHKQT